MMVARQASDRPHEVMLALGAPVSGDGRTEPHPALAPPVPATLERTEALERLAGRGTLGAAVADAATSKGELERTIMVASSQPGTRAMNNLVLDLGTVDLRRRLDELDPAPAARYEWDFGDGTSAVTDSPVVSHDFFDGIDHAAGFGTFHVSVTAAHSGVTTIRTLTVFSAYAACRRLGTIVPRVVADTFASKRYSMLSASFSVQNVEDEPLVLDQLSVTPVTQDPDAMALPSAPVSLGTPVTVPANSTSVIAVNVPIVTGEPGPGALRHDIAGFTAVYSGTAGALPVRVGATFEVPAGVRALRPVDPPRLVGRTWPWELVTTHLQETVRPASSIVRHDDVLLDTTTGTLAVSLDRAAGVAGPTRLRESIDRVLGAVFAPADTALLGPARTNGGSTPTIARRRERVRRGERVAAATSRALVPAAAAEAPAATLPATALLSLMHNGGTAADVLRLDALNGPPSPGPVAEGQICDPTNITDDERRQRGGQLVCQRTEESIEVQMPAAS